MKRRFKRFALGFAIGVALAPGAVQPALAVGYWNIPGNFCQWFGYGRGPGYHAPLVLGPISNEGLLAHDVVRLPAAPSVHAAGRAMQPPFYAGQSSFYQPTLVAPAPGSPQPTRPASPPGPVFR